MDALLHHPWFPVFLLGFFAMAMAGGMIIGARLLGPRRPTPEKDIPYECGAPLGRTGVKRISISYYMVALMFILFDIEAVFLYLWAPVFKELKILGLIEMGFFLIVLVIGYLYIVCRGALEWD